MWPPSPPPPVVPVIAGRIGAAPADWLAANRTNFFGVFGFGPP